MAWQTPSTVSTGDILEAATWNQAVVANSLMGQPVFANEAARDAAIPSPTEGMVCYLTAPTVPAASGDTYAATPTGVQTIYNGSVWVCVTPVSATTNASGTSASTSWTTTLTSGGTNPSVTLVTGTSAQISMYSVNKCVALSGRQTGIAVGVSGATTLTPSGVFASGGVANTITVLGTYVVVISADYWYQVQRTFTVTGLTAGTNTFSLYYITDGGTISFANRSLTVQGVA